MSHPFHQNVISRKSYDKSSRNNTKSMTSKNRLSNSLSAVASSKLNTKKKRQEQQISYFNQSVMHSIRTGYHLPDQSQVVKTKYNIYNQKLFQQKQRQRISTAI